MWFADTETCGLTGPAVISQRGRIDGPVELFNFWTNKASLGLEHIDELMRDDLVMYNAAFDSFQYNKIYNMLRLILKEKGNVKPYTLLDDPEYLIDMEFRAIDGVCVKPKAGLDLMLFAQQGPYQKCMERKEIRIRRIPLQVANELCELLNANIVFDSILFMKGDGIQWKVGESKDAKGVKLDSFRDVYCKFKPSFSLKHIATDLGIVEQAKQFKDVGAPQEIMPSELNFAPYAKAFSHIDDSQWPMIHKIIKKKSVSELEKLKLPYFGTWPHFMKAQIDFWETNKEAREYASDDVVLLREMYKKFGCPSVGDDNSTLAFSVGACRYRGYDVDEDKLRETKENLIEKVELFPEYRKTTKCLEYIQASMSPIQRVAMGQKTDKVALSKLSGPAGERARIIEEARSSDKMINIIDKLLISKRLFAGFRVMGTLSDRMSGSDGLNPQGIPKSTDFRSMFPLGNNLHMGDFDAFEVSIFEAVSSDENLRKQLVSGKKIHALYGTYVYDIPYEEMLTSPLYKKAKAAVFATMYGAQAPKLANVLGITEDDALVALGNFYSDYPGVGREAEAIKKLYSPLKQDAGGRIAWYGCQTYVESLYGFKRYFDIELQACKGLFDLASNLPKEWNDQTTVRSEHKGQQTVLGACMSALYGAAFSIQNQIQRCAGNHRIQSTGAGAMKKLQRNVWDIQPPGSSSWVVQPMQIHDELCVPCTRSDLVERVVKHSIEEIKQTIPLCQMEFSKAESWAA